MRLLFDAFWWADGPASNRLVLRELVKAWREQFPTDELHLATTTAARDLPAGIRRHHLRIPQHGAAIALELPRLIRRVRPGAVLTHNYAPLLSRAPAAVFIQDVLFQTNPEWFTRPERLYFGAMPLLARRADLVLASTAAEAQRIRQMNAPLRRVEPVGLGIASALSHASPERPAGLPGERFVLAVGRLNVRKNLAVALDAAAAAQGITTDCPLVVVGTPEGRSDARHGVAMRRAIADGRIVFLGRISDGALRWLYEHALALVYPSKGEGFGLPPIEALHFGCPVIANDLPVFRETVGAHATLVDCRSAPPLTEAIDRAIRRGRGTPAADVAARYAWPAVAARIRAQLGALAA